MAALYGFKQPKNKDIFVGMRFWITKEIAEKLSAIWRIRDKDYTLPYGVYTVKQIVEEKDEFDILIQYSNWGPTDTVGLSLDDAGNVNVYKYGWVGNVLRPFAENVKELDRLNSRQITCMLCGQSLNMLIGQLKCCNSCEARLNAPSEAVTENHQSTTDNDDTDEITIDFDLLSNVP